MITTGSNVPIEGIKDPPTKQAIRILTQMLRGTTIERSGSLAALPTDLTPGQAGALYYADDYDRLYRWTGSSWTDDWEVPPRRMVGWFDVAPNPSTGWAKCDGRTVFLSQPDGSVKRYQTPIISRQDGMVPWIRI